MRQDKFRGNVFVANLPSGFTDEQLAATFDDYGLVLCAFLARDAETGTPKTHGLVSLAPDSAAEAAIAALNGSKIGNKHVEVRRADPEMALTIPRANRPRPPQRAFGGAPEAAPRLYAAHDGAPRAYSSEDRPERPYAASARPARPPVVVERVVRPRRQP
jgi:RNA recognition motif-containing protein